MKLETVQARLTELQNKKERTEGLIEQLTRELIFINGSIAENTAWLESAKAESAPKAKAKRAKRASKAKTPVSAVTTKKAA